MLNGRGRRQDSSAIRLRQPRAGQRGDSLLSMQPGRSTLPWRRCARRPCCPSKWSWSTTAAATRRSIAWRPLRVGIRRAGSRSSRWRAMVARHARATRGGGQPRAITSLSSTPTTHGRRTSCNCRWQSSRQTRPSRSSPHRMQVLSRTNCLPPLHYPVRLKSCTASGS